jgi:hypothetical protein
MSDLTAIVLILASHGLLILCTIFLYNRSLRRKDEIVAGVVRGLPVSTKERWNMLIFEFVGYGNIVMVQHGVFAFGYFRAASVAGNPAVGGVALLCGWAALFGLAATLVPGIALTSHLVSILRQAEAD